MRTTDRLTGLVPILAGAALAGCAQLPHGSVVEERERPDIPEPPPVEADGSLYQADRGYQPLFEDRRPRAVGDILTIVLDEQASASKSARSRADRSGAAALEAEQTPEALEQLAEYLFEISGESDFEGGGDSQANNSFTGTITVTVAEVLGNGNLFVYGEKQIGINQGAEYIRLSGVVDPRSIRGDNTVVSTQVADARIEYVGDGYIDEAQHMGWLQRLLLNLSPF